MILRDVLTMPDGGKIAVGDVNYHPAVLRLKDNGDILWSKTYDDSYEALRLYRILRSSDGNYYLFSNAYFVADHYVYGHVCITKIDENGNLLWSKKVDTGIGGPVWEVADVAQLEDDGFVMLINQSWGSGSGQYTYVLKFDAAANPVWEKELDHSPASPVYKSVTVTDNAVLVAWDSYDYYNTNKFGVDKLSLATGEKIWTNRYTSEPPNYHGNPLTFDHINRILSVDDTIYVFIDQQVPTGMFTVNENMIMVKLHPNGDVLSAALLNTGKNIVFDTYEHLDVFPPSVTISADKDFMIAHRIENTAGQSLNLTRINRNGNAIWSRNYPSMGKYGVHNVHSQGTGFVIVGAVSAPTADNSAFTDAFILKVDDTGQPVNSASTECAPVDAVYTRVNTNIINNMDDQSTDISISFLSVRPGAPVLQPFSAEAALFCSEPGNCSPVTIKKATSGCAAGDTLIYYLKDADQCDATATWKFDRNFFKLISDKKDTLKLLPMQKGMSPLTVDLEGNCFFKRETISASVQTSAREINVGEDTLLCPGSSIDLKAPEGYAAYEWNNGVSSPIITVHDTGKYYVTVTDNCGSTGTDTINVLDAGKMLKLTPDTVKCNNDTIILAATPGLSHYQWQPMVNARANDYTVRVNPSADARYVVSAELFNGCTVKDSVEVKVLHSPAISFNAAPGICEGDSVLLDVGAGFVRYNWSTGETSSSVILRQAGRYAVKAVYSNNCISGAVFNLSEFPVPHPLSTADPSLCKGSQKILYPDQPYVSYLWSGGSTQPQLIIQAPGQYWLTATDEHHCTGTDTVLVVQKECLKGIFVPNAFTPNRDGRNDAFRPVLYEHPSDYLFVIFNRWGQKVFETNDPGKSWDGNIKGVPGTAGSYVWYCRYTQSGQPQSMAKGLVLMIR